MGVFAAGQVVVMPFPFSDLSRSKYRPALLLADVGHRDFIACQITSNPYSDSCAVTLDRAATSTKEDWHMSAISALENYSRSMKIF